MRIIIFLLFLEMGCEQSNGGQKGEEIVRLGRREGKQKKLNYYTNEDDHTYENVVKMDEKPTEEDIEVIQKILTKHFFFYKLTKQQKRQLISQIQIYSSEKDSHVFRQGDPATMFFLIRSGSVKVEFDTKENGEKILRRGEYFGELALLYKAPRSATIVSLEKSEFFCISHKTFRRTMQEVTIKNYDIAKEYIQKAHIFNYLTSREKNAIAYNAHSLKYQKGEVLFKEGDDANSFYMVIKGKISIEIPGKPLIIMSQGQSFGQNAFQKGQFRNGTATAIEKTSLLSIGRQALRKCIGTALDELNNENIMKWALRRHEVLKNLSDLQREKIISIATIKNFDDKAKIFKKGSIADSFIICLEGKINDKDVGSIHNLEFIFEKEQNELRITDPIEKDGAGKVAFFSFEAIKKVLGRTLKKCLDQKPTMVLNKSIQKKEEYIKNLKLQEFMVKYELGQGMFGKVLCVEDPCKKLFALKCIKKRLIVSQHMEDLIVNEKRYLEEINSPFIVELHKSFADKNYVYFLMKFIDGGDFFQILRSYNEFNRSQTQFYIGCIINAVEALHSKNIIYRDIKPENAVADREGYLYLVDLGTAKRLTEDKGFKTFTIIGTPHYMAPEIIQGQGYSFPVDLWSLGVFLYEVVCGYFPFGDDFDDPYEVFKQIQNQELKFPSDYTDASGIILLEKLLSKDERERQIEDFSKLKNMAYFDDFNWEQLDRKTMDSPFTINREKLNKTINITLQDYIQKLVNECENQDEAPLTSTNRQWNEFFENF